MVEHGVMAILWGQQLR